MAEAALVTGGAVRLGREIALALARAGYDVILHYFSSETAAQKTAAEIEACGVQCWQFPLDLRRVEEIDEWLATVKTAVPHLSVLVNSASVYSQARIGETTPTIFDEQWQVNVRAPFFLTQAFAALVGQGHVVNVIDNKIGFNQYEYAAYLLAKKALAEFTKMAALEFAPAMQVNGVAPGVVLPAVSRSETYIAWRKEGIPLKIQGTVKNVTDTILFILGNGFVTGQVFVVDGGESTAHVGRNAGAYGGEA